MRAASTVGHMSGADLYTFWARTVAASGPLAPALQHGAWAFATGPQRRLEVAARLAQRAELDPSLRAAAAAEQHPGVRAAFLTRADLSDVERAALLGGERRSAVLCVVAGLDTTPAETLAALSTHRDPDVTLALAANGGAPADLRAQALVSAAGNPRLLVRQTRRIIRILEDAEASLVAAVVAAACAPGVEERAARALVLPLDATRLDVEELVAVAEWLEARADDPVLAQRLTTLVTARLSARKPDPRLLVTARRLADDARLGDGLAQWLRSSDAAEASLRGDAARTAVLAEAASCASPDRLEALVAAAEGDAGLAEALASNPALATSGAEALLAAKLLSDESVSELLERRGQHQPHLVVAAVTARPRQLGLVRYAPEPGAALAAVWCALDGGPGYYSGELLSQAQVAGLLDTVMVAHLPAASVLVSLSDHCHVVAVAGEILSARLGTDPAAWEVFHALASEHDGAFGQLVELVVEVVATRR